jgi:hypothetical protein
MFPPIVKVLSTVLFLLQTSNFLHKNFVSSTMPTSTNAASYWKGKWFMEILKMEKPEKGMGKFYLTMEDEDGVIAWQYRRMRAEVLANG